MFIIVASLYSSIMEIKRFNSIKFLLVFALIFYILILIGTLTSCKSQDSKKVKIMGLEKNPYSKYEYLDNDSNILHWEIIDDSLHIYTKQDSINDEIERWRYVDSLYRADDIK